MDIRLQIMKLKEVSDQLIIKHFVKLKLIDRNTVVLLVKVESLFNLDDICIKYPQLNKIKTITNNKPNLIDSNYTGVFKLKSLK